MNKIDEIKGEKQQDKEQVYEEPDTPEREAEPALPELPEENELRLTFDISEQELDTLPDLADNKEDREMDMDMDEPELEW